MQEDVVFRFSAKDFFKDLNDPKISIIMSILFLNAVRDIVEKACGDRMKHPQVITAHDHPELTIIVPEDTRNIFLRIYNGEIFPAILRYLSTVTM